MPLIPPGCEKGRPSLYRPLIIGWLHRQGVPPIDRTDQSLDGTSGAGGARGLGRSTAGVYLGRSRVLLSIRITEGVSST